MNDEELKQLPANDEFAQCMRKLRISSDEFTSNRKEEMKNCNHLFVLLKKGTEIYGCHSSDYFRGSDIVECAYCGLTNKFNKLEVVLDSEYIEEYKTFNGMLPSLTGYNRRTLESEMFEVIFKESYSRGGKSFNNLNLNLISEDILLTCHPGLLYKLALIINPNGDNQELFKIMNELNNLETIQEKIRLQTIDQATLLLERYRNFKSQNLVLKLLR